MRRARSYSIIDHELLHGGYLHRLSHEALILYLFLVVVADRNGRSFYGDATIMGIVRLNVEQFNGARQELIRERLVDYRSPNWWVTEIVAVPPPAKVSAPLRSSVEVESGEREFAKKCLREISAMLSEKRRGI